MLDNTWIIAFGRWCMWCSFQSRALPCSSRPEHSSMCPLCMCLMNSSKVTQGKEPVLQTNSVTWNCLCSRLELSYLSRSVFCILINQWHEWPMFVIVILFCKSTVQLSTWCASTLNLLDLIPPERYIRIAAQCTYKAMHWWVSVFRP